MKNIKKIFCLLSLILLMQSVVSAQVVIRPGTSFGFSTEKPDIIVNANGNITTNGADLSSTNLQVNAISDLSINGDLAVTTLRLINGDVLVNNILTISQAIEFSSGLITPAASGKIVYAGAAGGMTGAHDGSFVNGALYQPGGGNKFYPVGTGSLYAPLTFDNIGTADEIGVELVAEDPALTFDPEIILSLANSHYWNLLAADPNAISAINSRVSLSLNGTLPVSEGSYAVMQAPSTSSEAVNLRYTSIDESQVTSSGLVTNPILLLGTIKEIIVKVRDLITPFRVDNENDKLYIEQIDAFDFNTVTMLDRWGGVVKRWENFTNEIDYDFSTLSPGNYIVVVEFGRQAEGGTTQKISQMVTVLKTN
jgi:hypothetical protein